MNDLVIARFLGRIAPVSSKIRTIYLFGSRARGTARLDSDYDLALVVADAFSLDDKDALYEAVMDILLDTGRLVSLKIFKTRDFQRLCELRTPFTQHLLTEGIQVG